ncbi:MAG: metallophosphoesterase [Lachnospiraceae bacterium]|nr:metallophosphoesterase [Lachnospiraceae bacterium]
MKILLVGDVPCKSLWDFYEEGKLKDYDLILSSGDLPAEYLSFLVTFSRGPVLYVHGNHDEKYIRKPPEGCICIEDTVYEYQGVRIMGLGGSMRYREGNFQYTEKEMEKRIRKMRFKLCRSKGFDILLTHAPAHGLNDREDLPHQGFQAFLPLLERYEPKYMVHGHVHLNYGYQVPRTLMYKNTMVVNSYEKYVVEL